jgi:hypothetical protein
MAETRKEYNPAYKGLAPREYEMSIPSEGEIFLEGSWSGEEGRFVPYQRVGDKIQRISFDPNKIYSQFNVSEKARMDSVKGIPAYYDKSRDALIGVVDRYGREEVLLENASQQFGGTPQQYNIGDVRRYLGDAGWAYDFTPMQTTPETPAEPTTTITGEGALSYKDLPGYQESKTKQNNFEATQEQLEQARSAAIKTGKSLTEEYGESDYTGPSIVDYLKSLGKESSFSSRAELAEQVGIENYRGTAKQNTKLLNTLKGGTLPLAGGIKKDLQQGLPAESLAGETTVIEMPNRPLEGGEDAIKDIQRRTQTTLAGMNEFEPIIDLLKSKFEETRELKEEEKGKFGQLIDTLKGVKEERPSMQDYLQEQYEEWGIPSNFSKIQKVNQEISVIQSNIAEVKREKQQALMQSEQRQAPMSFIRGEKALVERQYNSELSALSAEMAAKASQVEALQNNLTSARMFISDAVEAMSYDTKQAEQDVKDFINIYGDVIDDLEEDEKLYFSTLVNFYDKKLDYEREEYYTKLDWSVDAASKGVDLGLSATDIKQLPLEEVAEIYQNKISQLPPEENLSQTERFMKMASPVLNNTRQELLNSMGKDLYVDPYVYRGKKEEFATTFPGKADVFDDSFAHLLSPQEREKLGVGGGSLDWNDLLMMNFNQDWSRPEDNK